MNIMSHYRVPCNKTKTKMSAHFTTKYMLAMFLTVLVWSGDKFSWAAVLVDAILPFPFNFSQQCYRKGPGKWSCCHITLVGPIHLKPVKPAAQAAGADPSWCHCTNRQNPPIQQNRQNFWTSNAIWIPFEILNFLKYCNIAYFMTKSTIFNR